MWGLGSARGSWPLTWRRPLGGRRCPRCGGHMRIGQAWDDCPGCGYSELKHSEVAMARQHAAAARQTDPFHERIAESIAEAETDADRLAQLQGFTAYDPPRELTTERRALQVGLALSFLFIFVALESLSSGNRAVLRAADPWLDGALAYLVVSALLSEFALNSGFVAARQLVMGYAVAVIAAVVAVLLTDPAPLVTAVTQLVFDPVAGIAWLLGQLLWAAWLLSFAMRELRLMRGVNGAA